MKRALDWVSRRGIALADVYAQRATVLDLDLDDGRLRLLEGDDFGFGIRVVTGNRSCYVCGNADHQGALMDAAREVRAAGWTMEPEHAPRSVSKITRRLPAAIPIASVGLNDKIEILRRAEARARGVSSTISHFRGTYHERTEEVLIRTIDGAHIHETRTRVRFGAHVTAVRGSIVSPAYEAIAMTGGFELFDASAAELTSDRAATRAIKMLDAVPASSGRKPIVLGPGVGGTIIHEACGHAVEADTAQRRESWLKAQPGDRIANPAITVVDDPTLRGGFASYDFDGEAIGAQRVVVVAGGELTAHLHDRQTAGRAGAPLNGHGVRQDFRHPPIPRMTNTYVTPGHADPGNIVRSVEDGLYVAALTGGTVDPVTGNCIFGVAEAYEIARGELGEAVRGASIIARAPAILQGLEVLGTDLEHRPSRCGKAGQWIGCSSGMPTALLAGCAIAGPQRRT